MNDTRYAKINLGKIINRNFPFKGLMIGRGDGWVARGKGLVGVVGHSVYRLRFDSLEQRFKS